VPSLDPLPDHVIARRRALGERIRVARGAAGLTQQGLGERVDLSRVTVSNVEGGVYATTIDTLWLIADALGVPLAELVAAAEEPRRPALG
jgi:transcriptional regulator with XRE-family HTH domain